MKRRRTDRRTRKSPSQIRRSRLERLENRHLLAVVFADSFETGDWAGNWVEGGQNDWFRSTQRATDGVYSAEVDGSASDATLTLGAPLDLSSYDSAQLTFDWLIESGFDSGEYLALDISDNGGSSWQTDVLRLGGNIDAENTWHSETVDLTPYASDSLLVRFRSKVSRSNEDANVDNVQITGSTPAFPPSIEYADFSDPTYLTLVGNAGTLSERLRVTEADVDRHGAAWYVDQQYVSIGFETTFQFQMGDLPGGGVFSFVIQNDSDTILGHGAHASYHQVKNSLAVEFDTVLNTTIGDPSDSHVSVQTNGKDRNYYEHEYSLGWFTTSGFKLNDGNIHTAKISYTPGSLSVYLDDLAAPQLTVPVDLGELLDLNLGRAWVGFGAATGGQTQTHDVLNWTFANTSDPSSTIGIADSSVIEGDSGSVNLDFVITRLGDSTESLTVDWTTNDGTAVAGTDYASSSGQITFAAGETEKVISVPVYGELQEEPHETFGLDISLAAGNATLVDGNAIGTILNDDVSISISDDTVHEGSNQYQFIEDAIQSSDGEVNATRKAILRPDGYLYVNTNVPPAILRFSADTGQLVDTFATLPASEQATTIRGFLFGPDDNIYAVDRTDDRVLHFNGSTGAYLGEFVTSGLGGLDAAKTAVFGADGNLYVISKRTDEVLRYQGPFGSNPGAFIDAFVSGTGYNLGDNLTFGPNGDLFMGSRDFVLRFDGAFVEEFVSPGSGGLSRLMDSGLVFGPDRTGDGQQDLYVTSVNTDEVLLYDGINGSFVEAVIPAGQGGLDLPGGITFDSDGNMLVAKLGGTDTIKRYELDSRAAMEVTLSQPSAVPVTVNYITVADSADSSDYTGVSGTLTFPPGVTTRTITVPTIDDATGESSETFQLVLSNPSGASITDDTGIATIIDDDSNNAPVAVDDAASAETNVEQIIDVLANDSDPDGDPIAIDSVESPTANGGTVVVNPDNTLSYTSAPGFTGSDTFSYTISDGQGGTATATVTVDVSEVSETAMFVADISFQSRKGNKEWRAIFEVRDEFGGAVVGASITVTFAGQTYSGQTDGNGQFRTDWLRLSGGSYEAEATDLVLLDYSWEQTLGWSGDSDGDDLPDRLLTF